MKKILTKSELATWRSLIGLAGVDGVLSDSEKVMLLDYIKANNIMDDQRAILEADIQNGVNVREVYPGITEPGDRKNLLNMGRVLFYRDGRFSANEKKIYEEIYGDQKMAVDFDKALASARKLAQVENIKGDIEEEKQQGFLARIFSFLGLNK